MPHTYSLKPLHGIIISTILFISTLSPAQAAFILTLDDLGTPGVDFSITDNGLGDDSPEIGLITSSGTAGNFLATISIGLSKPLSGGLKSASLGLNSVIVSGFSAGFDLEIKLTDTDFLFGPSLIDKILLQNIIGGTTDGTVTSQGYLDPGNNEFGIGGITTGLQTFSPGIITGNINGLFSKPLALFSLTEVITISHTSALDSTSFDKNLTASIPEPTPFLLLGMALISIAYKRAYA